MSEETTNMEETEISEDDLDKIMETIEREEAVVEQKVSPAAAPAVAPEKRERPKLVAASTAAPTKVEAPIRQTLSLELTGTINLKLSFHSGERSIEVFCTDDALVCRMADGTEFRIPIGPAADAVRRKSA